MVIFSRWEVVPLIHFNYITLISGMSQERGFYDINEVWQ